MSKNEVEEPVESAKAPAEPEGALAVLPEDPRQAKKEAKRAAKQQKKLKALADASLLKAMPQLDKLMRECGYTYELRINWLEHFAKTQMTEQEVVAIVAPTLVKPAKRSRRPWRSQLTIAKHGLQRWVRTRQFLASAVFTGGWMYLLLASASKLAWSKWAIISVLAIVIPKIRFVMRSIRSQNMLLVSRGYNERKVLFGELLENCQRWYQTPPTPDQVDRFRRDALTLIANYVRDHRERFGSREILANLLVRRGEQVVVIGRSDGLRQVPQAYSREQCTLVWQAISTGEPQITGDLYGDFPGTVPGKRYNSVIVLPVWFRGAVIGAVSIDSSDKYHFHLGFDALQVHVAPYVQLLAATLLDAHDKPSIKALPGG